MRLPLPILLLALLPAGACDIPVFRFGMDYWLADDYRLETPAEESALFPDGYYETNLFVEKSDSPDSRLLFPDGKSIAWTGQATPENFATLLISPARTEIANRLLSGQSAVWIYVESGDVEKDEAAFSRVEERLKYIESIAELPEIDPTDPSNKMGPGPELRIGFSLLRIPHDAPEERFFLETLRGPEGSGGDIERPVGGFFVPVFARGRALALAHDHETDDALIDDACLFLLSACSCEAKHLNPGWDLLFNIDWPTRLEAAQTALITAGARSPSSARTPATLVEPETLTIAAAPEKTAAAANSKSSLNTYFIDGGTLTKTLAGAILLTLIIATAYFLLRKKSA